MHCPKIMWITMFTALCSIQLMAQNTVFPGADEKTPSRAQYFSWINNTNEGTTEEHTQINLDFFRWLKEAYGMQLDIYAFDAGAIDGKRFYGSVHSDRFKRQFPYGFDSIYKKASLLGIRLGVWGGPDGFGDTPEEEAMRTEQMVSLCRDYEFVLFKFDAVCGPLRPEKEDAFINMMEQCRTFSPDLILLNHRLGLQKAKPYATTFLWGGAETYIDVFMTNNTTAPHHRAGALSRGLVPELKRLTEDHGVCLSSCLDYWDDDLILQAFNRNLILAPEIYANPWLLRDDEFPKLARIYNLHKKYRDIMVDGMVLPESYGDHAVARGNGHTRLLTLKNLTWETTSYTLKLGEEIGLDPAEKIKVIQWHPGERFMGEFDYNGQIEVSIPPFRSALYLVTSEEIEAPIIEGATYEVVRNIPGKSVLIDVLGKPGTRRHISIQNPTAYDAILLDGKKNETLEKGSSQKIQFQGEVLKESAHRKLADFSEIPVPQDAEALYEATVFAADNNALEVRSLERSGPTEIPEVKAAREAFFNQKVFVDRGIWDKNLFDNDLSTGFWQSKKYGVDQSVKGGALRIDFGSVIEIDSITLHIPDIFSLQPLLEEEGNYVEVSTDLKSWETLTYMARLKSTIVFEKEVRYLRFRRFPQQIVEITGFKNGLPVDRSAWRVSNLFAHSEVMKVEKAWQCGFILEEIPKGSYLSVALNGDHGIEGAYVAARVNGKLIGAPDRAVSYPSNTWEYVNARRKGNYTYYIPLNEEMVGAAFEVVVLAFNKEFLDFKPEVWISAHGGAQEKIRLELQRK